MFTVTSEAQYDDPADDEPQRKRQRLEATSPSIQHSLPAAFHLLRTEGIAAEANECVAGVLHGKPAPPVPHRVTDLLLRS